MGADERTSPPSESAEVFICHASDRERTARDLAELLEEYGFQVWLAVRDSDSGMIPNVLTQRIETAACVVVLWSEKAVDSRWVLAEAQLALELNKLVAVALDSIAPSTLPVPFNAVSTLRIRSFRPPEPADAVQRLRRAIGQVTDRPPPPGAAVRSRWPTAVMATLLAGVVALGAYLTWPARPCAGVQRAQVHQLSLETNEVFGFDLLALNGGGPAEIVSGGRRHDVTAGGIEIIELRPTDGPARLDLLAGADGAGQSLVLDPKSGNLVVRARLANGQVSTFSGPTEIYRRGTDWVALLAPGRRAPLRALHSGSEICWTNPIVRMLRLRGGTLEVVRWVDG